MIRIAALLLAVGVVGLAARKKQGIPDSISEIAYIIPHTAFTVWIVLVGMLLMPLMMDALPDELTFLGFLCAAGLFCVAASPFYKTEESALHYMGGSLCAICATVVVAVNMPLLLLLWTLYAAAMVWQKGKCWCFWAEVTVYLLLLAAL